MKLFTQQMIDEIDGYKKLLQEKDLQLKKLKEYYLHQQKLKDEEISQLKKSHKLQIESLRNSLQNSSRSESNLLSQIKDRDKLIESLRNQLRNLKTPNLNEIEEGDLSIWVVGKSNFGTQTEDLITKIETESVPPKVSYNSNNLLEKSQKT